ncbi:MAG: hypothetical protein DMF74_04465 [Acidobacteria bacterium]|nr:MAG: hypothetical protein DMF74_04465 [Acidobacteriota bacterium]
MVLPNWFPEKLVPAVNVAPLLTVMAPATAPSNLCAAAEKVIEPLMLPVVPLLTLWRRQILKRINSTRNVFCFGTGNE